MNVAIRLPPAFAAAWWQPIDGLTMAAGIRSVIGRLPDKRSAGRPTLDRSIVSIRGSARSVGRRPCPLARRRRARGPASRSRRARAAAIAAATRAGAVPPMTSAAASEPSIVAPRRAASRRSPARARVRRAAASSEAASELLRALPAAGRTASRTPSRSAWRDQRPDDVVGGPERHAAPDERVGDGRRGRVALGGRGRASASRSIVERRDQPGHDRERRLVRRDRAEQRRLVLLEIALVAERQALEQRRGRRSAPPITRAARPRTSSAGSGLRLFGIIELPVEYASATRTNPNARVRPPRDLLGEPAEVDHPERDRGERLDDEVAIADGVERVRGDAVEPELRRGRLAVERVAGAGQRAATRAG